MKIYHHNDDDGFCSAAIVRRYLCDGYDIPTEDDFFVYNYNGELPLPELRKGETVYIVDLALTTEIMKVIRHAIDSEAKVIHIDHHESTKTFMENATVPQKAYLDQITHFYEIGVSGCLMTFAFSCFNEEQRKNPEEVNFWDDRECRDLYVENRGPYSIPLAVGYINDWDIWAFKLKETEAFHEGFYPYQWRSTPWDKAWLDLFNRENMLVPPIIDAGYAIVKYKEAQYMSIRKNAFAVETEFGRCICINTDAGSSKVFGDLLKQYDFGCMFRYNGKIWINSLRSDEASDINVAEIAEKFGGGGHTHAASFTSESCRWCG